MGGMTMKTTLSFLLTIAFASSAFAQAPTTAAQAPSSTANSAAAPTASTPASAADGTATQEARDAEARSLFLAGQGAYNDGRFEEALGHFTRSHELSGRPQLLANIGHAAENAGRPAEAADAFERYLEAMPDADNANYLRSKVERLRIQASSATPAAPPSANTAPDPLEDTTFGDEVGEPELRAPDQTLPIALMVTGGVLVAAGVGTAFWAKSLRDGVESECGGMECVNREDSQALMDDLDLAGTLGMVTDLLWLAGGATLITGLVLFLTAEPEEVDPSENEFNASVGCSTTGCMGSLSGTF